MHGTTPGAHPGAQSLIDAGTKALNDNRLDEAMAHLSEAARAQPSNGQVWTMLGIAYLRRGMIDEALNSLVSAAHLRPSNATTRYFLGLAYKRGGHAAAAAEQFQFALQIDLDYHEARQALGEMGPEPVPAVAAGQAQPMASQPGNQGTAVMMEQMERQPSQRPESSARLRRGLMAFGVALVALLAICVVCIPLLIRSRSGSPTAVVRQYVEARYVRKDGEAARRLTVEGTTQPDAFSELSEIMSQEFTAVEELRSYVVGQPTIRGNRAEVPVEMSYVDGHGQIHEETFRFVMVGCGPAWRVSLLESLGGGLGASPSYT